jgi:hypothetical protein
MPKANIKMNKMNYKYATVKASPGFWANQIFEITNLQISEDYKNKIPDQIIFDYNDGQVFYDISNLSMKYPSENFWVETSSDDVFENHVCKYLFRNGSSDLYKDGLEYVIEYANEDFKKIPRLTIEKFEERVKQYYEEADKYEIFRLKDKSRLEFDPEETENEELAGDILMYIKIRMGNTVFTATKYSRTFISVHIDFLDQKGKTITKNQMKPIEDEYED